MQAGVNIGHLRVGVREDSRRSTQEAESLRIELTKDKGQADIMEHHQSVTLKAIEAGVDVLRQGQTQKMYSRIEIAELYASQL